MRTGVGLGPLLTVCSTLALVMLLRLGAPPWALVDGRIGGGLMGLSADELPASVGAAGRVGSPEELLTGRAWRDKRAAGRVAGSAGAPTGQAAAEAGLTRSASRVSREVQVFFEDGRISDVLTGPDAGVVRAALGGESPGAEAALGGLCPAPGGANPHGFGEAAEDGDVEQDIAKLEALVELLAGAADHCQGLHFRRRKHRRACQRVSRVSAEVDAALRVVYAEGTLNLSAWEVAALVGDAAQAARRVVLVGGRAAGTWRGAALAEV